MTAPSIPRRGIRVQASMEWLFDVLIEGIPRPVPFAYTGAGPDHKGGGSVNMQALYVVSGYVAEAEDGRERLIRFYRDEPGHGGGEILTPSHHQLHLGAHGAAALNAWRERDAECFDLALRWLQTDFALLTACEVEGEPWTAGARAVQRGKLTGENNARGAFIRAVREGKAPKQDKYFLGALAVAALPAAERNRIRQPPDPWPAVQGGLTIKRWANGDFWCVFESLPTVGGGARAAGSFNGETWIEREGPPEGMLERYPKEPPCLVIRPEIAKEKVGKGRGKGRLARRD